MAVTVDGRSLTLESAARVAVDGEKVRIGAGSLKRMERFRAVLEGQLAKGETVYGANTGVGSLSVKAVGAAVARQAQLNLIRSHAAGVGVPMPAEVVRAAMLIRLNSLLSGNSAARPVVASTMARMLNSGVVPYVPSLGSLGASGDLVPSAHMALTMVGEGKAFRRSELMQSKDALRQSGLPPVVLEAKEGLSLINGTAFTTAFCAEVVRKGDALLDSANACASITGEVLGMCIQSLDPRLSGMKRSQSQAYVAERVMGFLAGSKRVRTEPVPQDPYSLRCVPQVHGALKDALEFARRIATEEMNSVSDNPVILEDGTALHGGNFHAQPVAMALDLLAIALSYLGEMSLGRTHYLITRSPSERKYMSSRPGIESGTMVLEYTASALAAENAKNAHPLSTYPANVSEGVEDQASYGVNAGLKAQAVCENVSRILAIELICASNTVGSDFGGLSGFSREALDRMRKVSPPLKGDRSLGPDIENLAELMVAGGLVSAATRKPRRKSS
jgi:histidine ammonia-lyase